MIIGATSLQMMA